MSPRLLVAAEWVQDIGAPIPAGSVWRPDLMAWEMPMPPPGQCHAYSHSYHSTLGGCVCGQRKRISVADDEGHWRVKETLT